MEHQLSTDAKHQLVAFVFVAGVPLQGDSVAPRHTVEYRVLEILSTALEQLNSFEPSLSNSGQPSRPQIYLSVTFNNTFRQPKVHMENISKYLSFQVSDSKSAAMIPFADMIFFAYDASSPASLFDLRDQVLPRVAHLHRASRVLIACSIDGIPRKLLPEIVGDAADSTFNHTEEQFPPVTPFTASVGIHVSVYESWCAGVNVSLLVEAAKKNIRRWAADHSNQAPEVIDVATATSAVQPTGDVSRPEIANFPIEVIEDAVTPAAIKEHCCWQIPLYERLHKNWLPFSTSKALRLFWILLSSRGVILLEPAKDSVTPVQKVIDFSMQLDIGRTMNFDVQWRTLRTQGETHYHRSKFFARWKRLAIGIRQATSSDEECYSFINVYGDRALNNVRVCRAPYDPLDEKPDVPTLEAKRAIARAEKISAIERASATRSVAQLDFKRRELQQLVDSLQLRINQAHKRKEEIKEVRQMLQDIQFQIKVQQDDNLRDSTTFDEEIRDLSVQIELLTNEEEKHKQRSLEVDELLDEKVKLSGEYVRAWQANLDLRRLIEENGCKERRMLGYDQKQTTGVRSCSACEARWRRTFPQLKDCDVNAAIKLKKNTRDLFCCRFLCVNDSKRAKEEIGPFGQNVSAEDAQLYLSGVALSLEQMENEVFVERSLSSLQLHQEGLTSACKGIFQRVDEQWRETSELLKSRLLLELGLNPIPELVSLVSRDNQETRLDLHHYFRQEIGIALNELETTKASLETFVNEVIQKQLHETFENVHSLLSLQMLRTTDLPLALEEMLGRNLIITAQLKFRTSNLTKFLYLHEAQTFCESLANKEQLLFEQFPS